jgi:hypothetical protein
MAAADWQRLPGWIQAVLDFNNTFSAASRLALW